MRTAPLRTLAVLLACILAGCTHYEPLSLHGAGSMRVEVELYKGPLTVSSIAQVGQLAAVLGQTVYALDTWKGEANAFLVKPPCPTTNPTEQRGRSLSQWRDCRELEAAVDTSNRMIDAACFLIESPVFQDIRGGMYLPVARCRLRVASALGRVETRKRSQGMPLGPGPGAIDSDAAAAATAANEEHAGFERDLSTCKAALDAAVAATADASAKEKLLREREVSILACFHESIVAAVDSFASNLRLTAFRSADANVRYVATDREIRGLLVGYGYIAAEFSNQIASRIAVLERELSEGDDPRLMPTGDYLRDARSTDFVNLFDWLDAARVDYPLGSPGRLSTPERVRMARRLTADYYWEKVNEVYTSGQGNISMAFIKDALGNWDLKSFSNDPSELLASYRKVADAALKTAASLAGGGGVNAAQKLTTAGKALALANRVAGGTVAPGDGDVPALHARIAARLANRADRLNTARANLISLQPEQANTVAGLDGEIATAKKTVEAASAAMAASPSESTATASADAKTALMTLQTKRETAVAAVAETTRRLAALPSEAIATMREVLDDARAEIGERQAAVVGAPAAAAQ